MAADWEKYTMCDGDDCAEAAVHFEAGAARCEECFQDVSSIDKFFYQHQRQECRKTVIPRLRGLRFRSVKILGDLAVEAEQQDAKRLEEQEAAKQKREAKKQRAEQEREAKKQRAEQEREAAKQP